MKDYTKVKEVSEVAYRFLMEFDPEKYEDGRHELEDGVYVNISTYTTNLRSASKFEAHKKYIDVQYIISGQEIMTVEPLSRMHEGKCLVPYSSETDAELYEGNLDGIDYYAEAGDVYVFGPEDAHMPSVCVGGPSQVRKAVVKVPVKA